MTKYSKIKKSSFAILALSLILVAVLAFGGTYAYFNAQVSASGSITTGTLKITDSGSGTLTSNASFVPNEEEVANVSTISFEGTTISALRIGIVLGGDTSGEYTNAAGQTVTKAELEAVIELEIGSTTGTWAQNRTTAEGTPLASADDANYYYSNLVGGEDADAISLNDIASVTIKFSKDAGNKFQGITFTYSITVAAAQAEHHETVDADGKIADGTTTTITPALASSLNWVVA